MHPLVIVGIVVAALLLLILAVAYYCYRRVFYSPARKPMAADEYEIPLGKFTSRFASKWWRG